MHIHENTASVTSFLTFRQTLRGTSIVFYSKYFRVKVGNIPAGTLPPWWAVPLLPRFTAMLCNCRLPRKPLPPNNTEIPRTIKKNPPYCNTAEKCRQNCSYRLPPTLDTAQNIPATLDAAQKVPPALDTTRILCLKSTRYISNAHC